MESLDQIRARLEAADSTAAVLSAAGDVFEFIGVIADAYALPGSAMFATWASLSAPACEGRNALGSAPWTELPESEAVGRGTDEDQAMEQVAALGVTLCLRLQQALGQVTESDDRRAVQRAADAAEEIRELLVTDG